MVNVVNFKELLLIQVFRKGYHFWFFMLSYLSPLRLTAIFGHLIKGILEPLKALCKQLKQTPLFSDTGLTVISRTITVQSFQIHYKVAKRKVVAIDLYY